MSAEMRCAAFVFGALAACTGAWADATPARADVMRKEVFVRRLLEAAQPPAQADSGAAALHARALEHLKRGEYQEADTRLSESIRSMLRRHAPGKPSQQPGSGYERLLSSVELMRSTYVRHASAREDSHGTLLVEVDESVAQARRLHAEQRPGEAVHALALAEQSLTHALTHLLGPVTVSYAPRFAGPEDEFRYEQARNRAYAALVPAAINELRPNGATLMLVQRYAQSAEATATLAARQAEKGDWRGALESVRNATLYLQRGLGAAGLAVAQGIPE
jgi:hypothetical protein